MKKLHKAITLKQTGYGCPETYDAFFRGAYVGHLRLRWGRFLVLNDADQILYAKDVGDGLTGIFDVDERAKYLRRARKRLAADLLKD